ncbi:MAG: restriction endonuclease subunit S [Solirubrobacterales bacterium]
MGLWREARVSELAEGGESGVAGGPFGSSLGRKDYVPAGVPVIRGAQLAGPGRFSLDGMVFVSDDKADRHRGNLAYPGDVIVTQRGTLGQVGLVPLDQPYERFLLSQSQMKISVDPAIADSEFLYFALSAPATKQRLINYAMTAGVPHVNLATLRAFELTVPDVRTQRRVAAVLSAFDELLEINERRIELLEDLARSLYREWFVHFRFPGHEGVALVDSGAGPIPAGWEAGTLDDQVVLARGFDLPVSVRQPGAVPIVSASGVTGSHSEAKASGPGVATGRSGTIGRVTYLPVDYWPLNTTLWVKEFRRASPRSAYFLLESLNLRSHATGAAVPTLNRNHISGLSMPIPPPSLVAYFDEVSAPLFEFMTALRNWNYKLVESQGLILPRLVSGHLDIADIDLGILTPPETE